MSLEQSFIANVVEAALMSAGQPLSLDKLHSLFDEQQEVEKEHIKQALEQLSEDLGSRGVELKEVSSGFRIQAKQDFAPWIAKLWEEKPPRYSRAILETMVLIAYRQPITRGEIEDVRGVSVSSHIIKTLLERDWVRVVGHRDVPGRPALYATTKGFLDYFNLKSLDELPSLSEIKDLDSINAQLQLQDGEIEGEAVPANAEAAALNEYGENTPAEQSDAAAADDETGEAGDIEGEVNLVVTAAGEDDQSSQSVSGLNFKASQLKHEEERSDALDAVDEALSKTKDVLERFERAVFHKDENVEEQEQDLDADDQREELAISEAVESLSHDDASEFITIAEDDDAVVVEEDSDSEAVKSLAQDDASEFITIAEDDDAVVVEEDSDVDAESETELSAGDTIESQQDPESVNDELNEDDYSKRQYESAEN